MQDWIGPKRNHFLAGGELDEVDRFNHSGSSISLGGRISDEVPLCLQKFWLRSANLGYLWRQCDLLVKSQVYGAAVRSFLLYGSETWLNAIVFILLLEHGRKTLSTTQVVCNVLDLRIQSLEQALKVNRLRCLGYIFRMPTERLSRCTLFCEAGRF